MTSFQWEYLIFGSYVILSGVAMIVSYSLTNPWWRSHLGRMMITYALAEIGMSTILMITVELRVNPVWFRTVWFVLQTMVGTALTYQTYVIFKVAREVRQQRREEQ